MDYPLARNLTSRVDDMLSTFRIVMVGGARQVGKTTLAEDLLGIPRQNRFTLDDDATLASATTDPRGFIESLPQPSLIDEFQRAGRGLLLAVKHRVDRDHRLTLWPLSAGEMLGRLETFIDHLFEPTAWPAPRDDVLRGLKSEIGHSEAATPRLLWTA